MRAKSIKGNSTEEIKLELQQSMNDGFRPTLAIVFISIRQDRQSICEMLHTKEIDIVGSTTCGEFTDGYQGEGSTVMILMDMPREAYTILFGETGEEDVSDLAGSIATTALKEFARPAFILCSTGFSTKGVMLDGEKLVRSIEHIVGPHVTIFGGMAGDDLTMTGTFVFTYGKVTDRGMIALVVDEEKISLHGMAISGWKPIGISRTITKSSRNLLYAIDDQTAIEMYLKYLGKEVTSGEDKYKMFEDIGMHYPFQIDREVGEPAMVSPMTIDREENALVCEANVPQGASIRFSMPPDFDIVETVIDKAEALKDTKDVDSEALLIFSCAGRLSALGPLAYEENQRLHEVWKSPMAGFYSYGEYGRAINSRQEFHSTTCCWVVLKERVNNEQ